MKLLMRPKPEKGESFIGYLVRLTELNAYDTPSWILSLADIDYMELQWTFSFVFGKTKGLKRFAQLTTNTQDDLHALVYSPANSSQGNTTEHEFDFYGASLNRSIIRPHHPKICPQCLAEFGYCFLVWDCSLVTACPIHECMLLDKCPKCRRQIRAIRKSISICACGYDWREIEPQFLSADELAVSRRVYQLCGLLSKTPKEENEHSLHSHGLRDFVVVLTFISGIFRKIAWATGRPSRSIKLANKDLHELYGQAYSVFENWPHNFHRFLSKQSKGAVRLSPDDGKLGTALKKEFGCLYEHLFQDLDGAHFDFMRESFAEFLTGRMKSQCVEPRREPLPTFSETDKYISVAKARRLLRLSRRAISDLIASGEVGFVIRNHGTTLDCVLRLSDVEKLKCEFEESMTCRDLAKEFCTDCETIRQLARKGLVKPCARRSTDAFNTLRFGRGTAEQFLQTPMGTLTGQTLPASSPADLE
jgi:hypothetical protein